MLELLNSAGIFDRIMVEYSYPECTASVLSSLSLYRHYFPSYCTAKIDRAILQAKTYIERSQREDGSWYGSWAICFTYGTFCALQGLSAMGQTYQTSARVKIACEWLITKQMRDGGWGEHFSSCEVGEYIFHEKSQVVNTSWALLALMSARYPYLAIVERGLQVGDFVQYFFFFTALADIADSYFEAVNNRLESGCKKISRVSLAKHGVYLFAFHQSFIIC